MLDKKMKRRGDHPRLLSLCKQRVAPSKQYVYELEVPSYEGHPLKQDETERGQVRHTAPNSLLLIHAPACHPSLVTLRLVQQTLSLETCSTKYVALRHRQIKRKCRPRGLQPRASSSSKGSWLRLYPPEEIVPLDQSSSIDGWVGQRPVVRQCTLETAYARDELTS